MTDTYEDTPGDRRFIFLAVALAAGVALILALMIITDNNDDTIQKVGDSTPAADTYTCRNCDEHTITCQNGDIYTVKGTGKVNCRTGEVHVGEGAIGRE